jgi:hypothetical protein
MCDIEILVIFFKKKGANLVKFTVDKKIPFPGSINQQKEFTSITQALKILTIKKSRT